MTKVQQRNESSSTHSSKSEFGCDSDEYFKVYSGHRAGEDREVFFVEEIVDCPFDREVCPFEIEIFLQYDIAHKIGWEFPGE